MCGIIGFQGKYEETLLRKMTDCLAHRGPDGGGRYFDAAAGVGLGHVRLAIIDLSERGLQPMWDASRRAVIVFNGEIYNYKELRAELERKGYGFKSDSDTEIILNLYLAEGENCVRRLNGMFAFALWDVARQELIVARDEAGIKPLYYTETSAGFLFASELKALLESKEVASDLDRLALFSYVTLLYCPSPRTPLKAVRKVSPGEVLVVKDGRIRSRHLYAPVPVYGHEISDLRQAQEELHVRLEEAVRRQMVSDVPVGAFLSGGLDSSAVVNFAKKSARFGGLKCFVVSNTSDAMRSEGFPDDLSYARRVARQLGVQLTEITVDVSMLQNVRKLVFHLDEPQADPASLNVLYVCEAARAAGVKVLLSGAGGDDVFCGYRRHHALMREWVWSWMPSTMRHSLVQTVVSRGVNSPLTRRMTRAVAAMNEESSDRRLVSYFSWLGDKYARGVFSREFQAEIEGSDALAPFLATVRGMPAEANRLEAMLALERRYFLPDHNLNYTDKMSMAAGIEVRVPFLDPDLVAFSRRLPACFKQRGAEGKWIFKKVMERYLPKDVIYRPKTGFGVPLRAWMHGELGEELRDLLSSEKIRLRGIFDAEQVKKLMEADRTGRVDAAYSIFAIACVEMWCRIFLDGK